MKSKHPISPRAQKRDNEENTKNLRDVIDLTSTEPSNNEALKIEIKAHHSSSGLASRMTNVFAKHN